MTSDHPMGLWLAVAACALSCIWSAVAVTDELALRDGATSAVEESRSGLDAKATVSRTPVVLGDPEAPLDLRPHASPPEAGPPHRRVPVRKSR